MRVFKFFRYLRAYTRWNLGINLWSCCFEPSHITTVTNCDICKNFDVALCDFVAICDQSHVVVYCVLSHWKHISCTWESTLYIFGINNSSIFPFWRYLNGIYLPGMYMNYQYQQKVPSKHSRKAGLSASACFRYLGVFPHAILSLIQKVVFWTLTNYDSHKFRQSTKGCVIKWVQSHWKRALCTWEGTPAHLFTWVWEVYFMWMLTLFQWCIH